MIVYLDIFLLYNTLINASVLYLSTHFNRLDVKHTLVLISATLGAALSIIPMFFSPLRILINISKLIIPAIMCYICSKNSTLKQYLKVLSTYILLSFILSGIALGIQYAISSNVDSKITILTISCSLLVLAILYNALITFFAVQTKERCSYVTVTIVHQGIRLNLTGFNDSGNSLTYGLDEKAVCICDYNTLSPIINNSNIVYETMHCYTINACGIIKIFTPDCIYVNGNAISAVIGISNIPLKSTYDIILNLNNIKSKETEISYV